VPIATKHSKILLHDIRYCRSNKVCALCKTVLALGKQRSIGEPDILFILVHTQKTSLYTYYNKDSNLLIAVAE